MATLHHFQQLKALKLDLKSADMKDMSTSPINSLSSTYLQSLLGTTLQNAGLTNQTTGTTGTSSIPQDQGGLSPFAQMLSALQQLQQTDPTKYQQVTKQIATNLQSAAQTAQSDGNTNLANQLNQLSDDFSTASQNGQLPNIQDLAQAVGGHHGHHHHHHGGGSSGSTTSTTDTSNSNQGVNQLLSALQSNSNQTASLNPMSIIYDTLSSAGVVGSGT